MQVRNSILVLDRLRDFFPLHQSNGEKIEAFIRDICDTETKRDDLKLLALGYLQKLNLSKPTWIENKRKSTNISTEVAEKSESNKLVSDSMPEIYQKNRDDIVDTKYSRGERRDGREKRKMNPSPDRNIQYDNYSRTRQQYSTKDSRTEVVERREERSSRNRDLVRTNSNAGKKAQDVANSIVVPSKNVEEDNLLSPKKMSIRSAVDVARKVAEKVVRADSSAGANSEKDAKSKADTAKLLEKLKTLEPGEVTLLPPEKKREEKREEPSRNRSRSRERKDVREKRDDRKEADSKLTRKRTEEFIESDREAKRKKNDNERSDRRNDDRSDRKDEERRSPRRDDRRKDDRDSRGRDSRDRRY